MSLGTLVAGGLGYLGGSMLGGGGRGGTTGQRTEQLPTLMPEQQNLLRKIIAAIEPQIGKPGMAMPGPSGLQQAAFQLAGGAPSALAQYGGMATETLGKATEPYTPESLARIFGPAKEYAMGTFREDIIPQIMAAFGGADSAMSGAAARAISKAGGNLALGLGSQMMPFVAQLEEALQGRRMGAAPQYMALGQLPLQTATGLGNIGAMERSIMEEMMASGDPWRNIALQFLFPSLGVSAFDTAVFQGYRKPSLTESIIPALGMMGGGYLSSPSGSAWASRLFS